jgi:hypothetical protein
VVSRRTVKEKLVGVAALLVAFLIIATSCGDNSGQVSATTDRGLAHPALECDGESSDFFEYDVEPDAPGAESRTAALDGALDPFRDGYGGEIVQVDPGTVGLSVDGAVVVLAVAEDAPAGGYRNDTIYFCRSFEPSNFGGPDVPHTAPLATS